MEKKTLELTVKYANMFTDDNNRIKIVFKFDKKFDARKANKATGEFVITTDNELSFTKKQFIYNLQDNFVINIIATNIKFEHLLSLQLIGMFKGVKLTIDRTRLEQGDTFVDIDGNEQTSDETMFLTELKDIEFTEDNINAIKSTILSQTKEEDKDKVRDMLEIVL